MGIRAGSRARSQNSPTFPNTTAIFLSPASPTTFQIASSSKLDLTSAWISVYLSPRGSIMPFQNAGDQTCRRLPLGQSRDLPLICRPSRSFSIGFSNQPYPPSYPFPGLFWAPSTCYRQSRLDQNHPVLRKSNAMLYFAHFSGTCRH